MQKVIVVQVACEYIYEGDDGQCHISNLCYKSQLLVVFEVGESQDSCQESQTEGDDEEELVHGSHCDGDEEDQVGVKELCLEDAFEGFHDTRDYRNDLLVSLGLDEAQQHDELVDEKYDESDD